MIECFDILAFVPFVPHASLFALFVGVSTIVHSPLSTHDPGRALPFYLVDFGDPTQAKWLRVVSWFLDVWELVISDHRTFLFDV